MLKLPSEHVGRLRPRYADRACIVTGGAGFIGGHLVDALLSLGARITVIDDLSNSSAEHLTELIEMEPDRVRFVHGSILDDAALAEAFASPAAGISAAAAPAPPAHAAPAARSNGQPDTRPVVFHLAAVSSVPRSIAEPERSYDVNTTGTLRVAEAARAAGAARVVYSASSSAYGASDKLPKVETDLPMPVSPYAASKLGGEHVMRAWAAAYGLSTVSLRYFNIFGPRQPADSPYSAVIAVFAKRLLAGQSPSIFGDGEQSRDFTYVANAVLANLLAGASESVLKGEVFNVGTGSRVSLNELAASIAAQLDAAHVKPEHKPPRVGDVRHSLADIATIHAALGYEPFVPLDEGLARTLAWYKEALAQA